MVVNLGVIEQVVNVFHVPIGHGSRIAVIGYSNIQPH